VIVVNLQQVPLSLLERELNYNSIGLIEIIGQLGFFAVALGVAVVNPTAWAPVFGWWAQQVVLLLGYWSRAGYRPRLVWQRDIVREMLGFGLDSALHTDPRVYRSTHPHFLGRLCDALSQVVITRTDSGGRAPAIANVASAFAAGQIQTIWMPANDAHTRNGLVSGGIMLLGDASRNVMREFWPDIERKFGHRD